MTTKAKNTWLWVAAVALTILMILYQRATGPTYPTTGTTELGGEAIKYKLLTSFGGDLDAPVQIKMESKNIKGQVIYKRYKSHDELTTMDMQNNEQGLYAALPNQPPAGKIEYSVRLYTDTEEVFLSKEPVIIRFKGAVPSAVLAPHVFFMIITLLFSWRAGLEALARGKDTLFFTGVALLTLILGGLILGPIVQKFAFGAYWTGWPNGHDFTDNKTAVVFIFWLIAWFKLRKNQQHRFWVFAATIVMFLVYVVPHSTLGSEIDHTKTTTEVQIKE